MAENSQERTEEATPKRKQDARKRGQVVRSMELPAAAALLAGVLVLRAAGPFMWGQLSELMRDDLANFSRGDLTGHDAMQLVGQSVIMGAVAMIPLVLSFMLTGIAAGVLQTGFVVSFKAVTPKFEKVNPMAGAKRLLSPSTGFELLKLILRLAILLGVMVGVLNGLIGTLLTLGQGGMMAAPGIIGDTIYTLVLRVALAGGLLAVLDYAFQRWKFNRQMRMTKQEVRDEMRQIDGDPQIKARIRKLQRQRARQRMMQEVPKSTVVITNPTHFAVALRYESGKTRAPIVVAKGQDHLAQQIKALAKEHGVPVVENPPLARALHSSVSLGREIPLQLYRAVAEVLAFVYKLKRKW